MFQRGAETGGGWEQVTADYVYTGGGEQDAGGNCGSGNRLGVGQHLKQRLTRG